MKKLRRKQKLRPQKLQLRASQLLKVKLLLRGLIELI
jgi:hypothetical protein